MGSELCNGVPDDEGQKIDDYNPDEQHADEQINKIIRKGEPSQFVGYNINKLPNYLRGSVELTKKQEQITKLMAHEKKNIKPMNISKNANDKNHLSDPYYIRAMDAVYVGEWVLDKEINQVVPGGLGRLYTEERIIEGEIVTKVLEAATFFDEDNIDFTTKMVSHNKEKASFFATTKNTNVENSANNPRYAYDDDEFLKIKVMLHGEGRSFTRNSQLRGIFVDGEISGKGYCRIKEGEDIYEYTGEFKEGKKNGKGIEKFKLTSYDGDFENDQKKGKGTLTLFISKAYEKERTEQDAKLTIQDKEKDPSEKILKVKEFVKEKNIFEHKLNEQLKKYYKWIPPKYPPKSMTENQNFVIEHHRRIKFLEYYKGDFDANQFHGHGTYTWFNGKCYNGEWSRGQMDGIGEFYWPKGIIYRGEYEKDNRHGKGEMIWGLEKRFRGSWAYGLRHGYGELIEVVEAASKRSEEYLQATEAQDNDRLKEIDEERVKQQKQEEECKRNKTKRVKQYYLRVIGALFDKDKLSKQFFKKFTLIEQDLHLEQLIYMEKEMIAFVKDIKMDKA